MSGWGLQKRRSAPPYGLLWLGKDFSFFRTHNVIVRSSVPVAQCPGVQPVSTSHRGEQRDRKLLYRCETKPATERIDAVVIRIDDRASGAPAAAAELIVFYGVSSVARRPSISDAGPAAKSVVFVTRGAALERVGPTTTDTNRRPLILQLLIEVVMGDEDANVIDVEYEKVDRAKHNGGHTSRAASPPVPSITFLIALNNMWLADKVTRIP